MLVVLYLCGKQLAYSGRMCSRAGIVAILVYTLNEGLRYGRGIDYNYYGADYEQLLLGAESNQNIGFGLFEKLFAWIGLPWQCCVMFMSFMFIYALLIFMKVYKDVYPYAVPLFVLTSLLFVENMAKWFLAYSFFLIALFYQLTGEKRVHPKFILYSVIACSFHYGFFPIPFVFYFLKLYNKPLLNPFWATVIFFGIIFLFQSSFLLHFVYFAQIMSMMSERYDAYNEDIEYWLTSGNNGATASIPGITDILLGLSLMWFAYYKIKRCDVRYVYCYNVFLVGLILMPIGVQIELVGRYYLSFFFFFSILLPLVICKYKNKKTKIVVLLLCIVFLLNVGRRTILNPIFDNPRKYMYVWDSNSETYDSMINMWMVDGEKTKK